MAAHCNALLSIEEMYTADRLAMEQGTPGIVLMEAAGRGIADLVCETYPQGHALILSGPGNNGGDGYVIARHLLSRGWRVTLQSSHPDQSLSGDAGYHAALWQKQSDAEIRSLDPSLLAKATLVVDALFGAGLTRGLDGQIAACVAAVNSAAVPVVAVDLPSGYCGSTGQALGEVAVQADMTITFYRRKYGHLLLPAREACGDLRVVDIGIRDHLLDEIAPSVVENGPEFWLGDMPRRNSRSHKYRHGHLLVYGSAEMTGAACLAGITGLRAGAGLVSLAVPLAVEGLCRQFETSFLVNPCEGLDAYVARADEARVSALVLGPGLPVDDLGKALVGAAIVTSKPLVLDAGGLTCFAELGDQAPKLHAQCVLTPHEGEFRRIFPDLASLERLEAARQAAQASGAVVVLKGADTAVAQPDGRCVINSNAPACLATAGSGDVLSGLIGGLLSMGMPAFEAAAAGVWLHGEMGQGAGTGCVASDLPGQLPQILKNLHL